MANEQAGLSAILTGMGSLSKGETAGARMRLGLMLNDPAEVHSCFADNPHNDHFHNGVGMRNVYLERTTRIDGTTVSGPSHSDLVAIENPALDAEMRTRLADAVLALGPIKIAAEAGFAHDEMLARGNEGGERLIKGGVDRAGAVDRAGGRNARPGQGRVCGLRQPRQPLVGVPLTRVREVRLAAPPASMRP